MKLGYLWTLTIVISSYAGPLGGIQDCVRGLKNFILRSQTDWIDDQVEIIYFDRSHHTKIRIGDDVWGNECPRNTCAHHSFEMIENAVRSSRSHNAQMRFRIRVTQDEMIALREFIENGRFRNGLNCTHSVCEAINQETGAYIPLPFALSPALNAYYLTMATHLRGSRVLGVQIINPNNLPSYFPSHLFRETGLFLFGSVAVAGVIYFTVTELEFIIKN